MTKPMQKTRWPKKMPITNYIQLHYTEGGRCRTAIINDIKRKDLPGLKEGGKWFIYVLPDGSPAYGYSEEKPKQPAPERETVALSGNTIADSILAKLAANNGLGVTDAA